MTDNYYIYGKHSVLSAIQNPKRTILEIWTTTNNKNLLETIKAPNKSFLNLLANKKLNIVTNPVLDSLIKNQANHQGVALKVKTLTQPSLDNFINYSKSISSQTVLMLDQPNDSGNIGAIIRSALAFGVDNIFLPKDNVPQENGWLAKSAAGALEKINLISVTNIAQTIEVLKKHGFWIVGFDHNSTNNLSNLKTFEKCCVVFGSEGKGLRKLTKQHCDLLVKINFNNHNVESLNLSNSVAIGLFAKNNL